MKNYFLLLFMACSLQVFSQYNDIIQPGKATQLKKTETGVVIEAENARMMIQHYNANTIRFRLSRIPFPEDFSYAVIQKPAGNFKEVKESSSAWTLTTDSLSIVVNKKPLFVRILNSKGEVLQEDYEGFQVTWQGTEVTAHKRMFADEKFIGLGEKTGPLNRRGEKYENWNSDVPAYLVNHDPLYVSIPFFMGIHDKVTYGIFLDNSYRSKFNFGASTDDLFSSFSAANGELNYYFFGASTIAGIIGDYTFLTGRMKLPPYWSLGYQQSRWSYFPEAEVLTLAQTFRDKKIPCDMIYLDIDYMDAYKIFTWHKERFSDPKGLISKLNGMGFHIATIVDPGIKVEKGYPSYEEGLKDDLFVKYPSGQTYIGSVWPGRCHFPDFTKEATRKWWGGSFSKLIDPGVEGFWNDMNEPAAWGQSIPNTLQFDFDGRKSTMAEAHNIYGLEMSRATYEGTKELLKGKRPFVLTRAAFSGIQRYSAVWTGDNFASDEHMLLSARMVNSMGMSGIPFVGPDLGGFMGDPTKELYERWLSLAIFTPFCRNHSAWDTKSKEPWSFGRDVEKFSIDQISLRYRLLPYIYSAFYQSTVSGLPIAKSLAINYTHDEKVYWWKYMNEFLFGDNFLVAPVSCTQIAAKIYLPAGKWYRFSTNEPYDGSQEVTVDAPLNDLPVFVKASGIIPLQSVIQYTDQKPSEVLELRVYSGNDINTFVYYEDDGKTYDYEKGGYCKREITYEPATKTIQFTKAEGSFSSKFTKVSLNLIHFGDVPVIKVNGKDYTMKLKSKDTWMVEIPLTNGEIEIKY
jgi:alpha-glucosidase